MLLCLLCFQRRIQERRVLNLYLTKSQSTSATSKEDGTEPTSTNMSENGDNHHISTGMSSTALSSTAPTFYTADDPEKMVDGQPPVPPPSLASTVVQQQIMGYSTSLLNLQLHQQPIIEEKYDDEEQKYSMDNPKMDNISFQQSQAFAQNIRSGKNTCINVCECTLAF